MILVEGLFSYLSNIGTTCGNRIYPHKLKQKAVLPAVTYLQVSDPHERSHSGPSKLRHPRLQLDCWAESYLAAKQLADEMDTAIEGYVGSMAGVEVNVAFVDDARDNYDPDTFRHWVSLDVIIWHQKP